MKKKIMNTDKSVETELKELRETLRIQTTNLKEAQESTNRLEDMMKMLRGDIQYLERRIDEFLEISESHKQH